MREFKLNRNSIFCLAWCIMVFYTFAIGRSELKSILPGTTIQRVSTIIAIALLMTKNVFLSRYSKSKIIGIVLFFVLIAVVTYRSKSLSLPVYFLFIVSASDIDIKKLIHIDMKIRMLAVFLLYFLGVTGVVSVFTREINGVIKYSFGWAHPNTFCGTVIIIVIEWLYLNWNRLNLRFYIVVFLIFAFLDKYAASRTTIYTALVVVMWTVLVKQHKHLVENRYVNFIYKWIAFVMAAISWICVLLYNKGTAIGIRLNAVLTSRLAWSSKYLLRYGINLWGTDIETVSSGQAALTNTSVQILDMSYVRLFIEYGAIYAIFFIIAFYYIGKYLSENEKKPELMLLLYFATVGIGSNTTMNLFSNFLPLLLIPSLVYCKDKRKKSKI